MTEPNRSGESPPQMTYDEFVAAAAMLRVPPPAEHTAALEQAIGQPLGPWNAGSL